MLLFVFSPVCLYEVMRILQARARLCVLLIGNRKQNSAESTDNAFVRRYTGRAICLDMSPAAISLLLLLSFFAYEIGFAAQPYAQYVDQKATQQSGVYNSLRYPYRVRRTPRSLA